LQYIDADDVARFTRAVCEQNLDDTLNLAGPRLTWGDVRTTLGARNVVWIPREIMAAAGVTV
jgi:hypothetical protein